MTHRSTANAVHLSVIVPVIDEAAIVDASLARLAPLRQQGAEVIVVDGGSLDDTLARAARQADHVLSAPRGRAAQMNAGAQAARGDVLLFLHADTRLPGNAAALIDAALAGGKPCWGRFDVRIEGSHPLLRVVAVLMNRRSRLTGIATGDQAIFMVRSAFEQVGGFPSQPLMEDIALSHRLKRLSPPACLRETVLTSARRWERHGVLRTVVLMWWLRLAYRLGVPTTVLARWYGYRPSSAER